MITRISWILDDNSNCRPSYNVEEMRQIGPLWGGLDTYREWYTDNVVSLDLNESRTFVSRNLHLNANLHVPQTHYGSLDRPKGIRLFEHGYTELFPRQNQLCSIMLLGGHHDILLLLQFKVNKNLTGDKLWDHNEKVYIRELKAAIASFEDTQFVAIDSSDDIAEELKELPNFTCDSYENVLELLHNLDN